MRALILLLLSMLTPAHAVAAGITTLVDKTDLVLGESITLEVRLQGTDTQALDAFTLDALQADFDVAAISRSIRPSSAIVTATLYPLRRGKQTLPAMNFLGATSSPIRLTVRDAGQTIPHVVIRTGIEPPVPHVREAARVYFEVLDNGSLQWAPVPLPDAPGIHMRALAETQRNEVVDGTRYVVHRTTWAALPLREGPLRVNFPRIHATKFGVRLRYAVPQLTFSAEPVPAWLPIHVPVGAPQLHSDALPAQIETQRPFNWQLRVTGAGLSEEGIVKVIGAALRESAALYFYPPTVQRMETPRATELQQTFLVTIPLRIQRAGEIELPHLVFPYYDATRAQLDAVRLEAPRVTAINPVTRTLLRVGAGLLMVLVGIALAFFLYPYIRRAQRRATALQRIRAAVDAGQLKAALLRFDLGGDIAPATTLRQWLLRARNTAGLTPWVQQLERACYGPQPRIDAFRALQSGLVAQLKRGGPVIS